MDGSTEGAPKPAPVKKERSTPPPQRQQSNFPGRLGELLQRLPWLRGSKTQMPPAHDMLVDLASVSEPVRQTDLPHHESPRPDEHSSPEVSTPPIHAEHYDERLAEAERKKAGFRAEPSHDLWGVGDGNYGLSLETFGTASERANERELVDTEQAMYGYVRHALDERQARGDTDPAVIVDLGGGMGMSAARLSLAFEEDIRAGRLVVAVTNIASEAGTVASRIRRGESLSESEHTEQFVRERVGLTQDKIGVLHDTQQGDEPLLHFVEADVDELFQEGIPMRDGSRLDVRGRCVLVHERDMFTHGFVNDRDFNDIAGMLAPDGMFMLGTRGTLQHNSGEAPAVYESRETAHRLREKIFPANGAHRVEDPPGRRLNYDIYTRTNTTAEQLLSYVHTPDTASTDASPEHNDRLVITIRGKEYPVDLLTQEPSRMSTILEQMRARDIHYETETWQAEIEGEITAGDIEALTAFPFETAIVRDRTGRVFLRTGAEASPRLTNDEFTTATMIFHTHPPHSTEAAMYPSTIDVDEAWKLAHGTSGITPSLFLANFEGLVEYAAPETDVKDMLAEFYDARGIGFGTRLTPDQERALDREFVESIGAITRRATWNQREEIEEIVRALNTPQS